MVKRIDQDANRFRQIVRGRIRENLRRYITHGEMIGRKGKNIVSIPIPQIELPRFTYGSNEGQGVGQGEGAEGAEVQPGEGAGEAGETPGEHVLEVEVTLEELAQILGEELELPRIKPKGKHALETQAHRYKSIRRVGPESLRHFRRTFRQALKRALASGAYDPRNPRLVFEREDRRYRSWDAVPSPQSNAVVIYMMDVSGSMGTQQKEIVRITAFWIDTWLKSQYRNLECRYIVHDAAAKEVDEHAFFHLKESGGTKISSALELCLKMIDDKYSPLEWNIYPFHFSDGDNWSGGDTDRCMHLLKDDLLPAVNVFCYGQVKSAYGSGQFKGDLDRSFPGDERVITSDIPDREGILDAIRTFLGKGR
jgi:sporulation protein YhbH